MKISCQKASLRASAAQWNLDALVSLSGAPATPCFFSVVPTWCTFQTLSNDEGERLLAAFAERLGPPSTAPQVVKGGACGGEEEEAEYAFAGAMVSVTWEFPKEGREPFLARIREALGPCEGIAA